MKHKLLAQDATVGARSDDGTHEIIATSRAPGEVWWARDHCGPGPCFSHHREAVRITFRELSGLRSGCESVGFFHPEHVLAGFSAAT